MEVELEVEDRGSYWAVRECGPGAGGHLRLTPAVTALQPCEGVRQLFNGGPGPALLP